MSKSFSDFVNTENASTENIDKVEEKVKGEDMSGFEELIKNYSSYSEDELVSEFLRLTNEGKKNGTINTESLKQLSETVKPMLNNKQRRMLEMFLNYIT